MFTRSPVHKEKQIAAVIGLALLTATYLAFSLRSIMNPIEPGEFMDLKRLVVAGVGAAMFLFIARLVRRNLARRFAPRIRDIAAMCLAALALVLVTRIVWDFATTGVNQEMLLRNVRWTIIWLGYFGTALLGYLAAIFRLSAQSSARVESASDDDRIAAFLAEVSNWTAADREALAAAIVLRNAEGADAQREASRYQEADPLFADLGRA